MVMFCTMFCTMYMLHVVFASFPVFPFYVHSCLINLPRRVGSFQQFPNFFKYCEKRPFPPQSSLIAGCFYEHFPFRVFLFLHFVMLIVFDDKIIKLGPMEET